MSNRSDFDLLVDIQEAAARIIAYTEGMNFESFLKDKKTQDAVTRNLEILGEAAKGLSSKVREKSPKVPWKEMAGTRDRLIHDYFGVNVDIVWNIIVNELPSLKLKINEIIDEHN